MSVGTILAFLFGLILLYVVGMVLVIPIRIIMKLLINALVGGVALFIFNIIGGIFNLSIAMNPLNAIIVGFLGVPGVILILILQFVL